MKKRKILVCDNKRVFFKMFKKKISTETDFLDYTFLWGGKNKDFDSLILVVYDEIELLDFLKLHVDGVDILICFFNKKLYLSFAFLNGFNNLFLLDGSRIKSDIIEDLKFYLKGDFNMKEKSGLKSFINFHTEIEILN